MISKRIFTIILTAALAATFACSGQKLGESAGNADPGGTIRIQGSGATFSKPIYEKWANEFGKMHPNVKIDYQGTGSGAGQKALINKTAEFGASDDPMSDEDMAKAGSPVLHIPTVLGAVVLTYNLASVKEPLRLTPKAIAEIYLGNIKKWNDPKLKELNPNAALPDADILPIYRADSSGTSAVFTDFLSKSDAAWKEKVGTNKQPSWVTGVGVGAKGNDGVMGQITQTPNSIGYVELTFAKANGLTTAMIQNRAGEFVAATPESVASAAAEKVADMPDDLRVTITDGAAAASYPIASYTYILVYQDQANAVTGKTLADFLWWALHDGSSYATELHYVPLPEEVLKKVEPKLNSMTSGGKALRQQ
jgi:phosphate transport system substrate-binding protein